jgi:hypothetical protein
LIGGPVRKTRRAADPRRLFAPHRTH